ncbi:MAG: aspartate/glutamate racemase family protein [Bacteroidales bacterium]|nr:aspartate/glutamate racemase family protein [Bacteroidales bacterium]
MNIKKTHLLLGLLLVAFFPGTSAQQFIPSLENQEKIKIIITDSGLGGIDVMNRISKALEETKYYKEAELIFVNAKFEENRGYNSLDSREEKIKQFNRVLFGIEKKHQPDVILIGCNTLSVLYKDTEFVKQSETPVRGIIEPGVNIISEELSKDPLSTVIITGTKTTISEDSHRKALLKMGYSDQRIVTQSCPELQSYIERAPAGDDTQMLISFYVEEALSKRTMTNGPVVLSLNCSHYGYAANAWIKALQDTKVKLRTILNPNNNMTGYILPVDPLPRYEQTRISLHVCSKVILKNAEAIASIFRNTSPALAEALVNYQLDKKLF